MPEDEAVPAEVVEIVGRTGMHGEVTQVKCKVLEGEFKGRIITRNCVGPIKVGDIIMILEPAREVRRLTGR